VLTIRLRKDSRRGVDIAFSDAIRIFEQSKRAECYLNAEVERK